MSNKIVVIIFLCLVGIGNLFAQNRYATRTGVIRFFSETPLEDIKAENKQVACIIDVEKGELAFSLFTKAFVFPNGLMQEHFNENYMESEKFPKATFKGVFYQKIDPKKDGIYKINVQGDLTLHGVTKRITVPASIEVKNTTLLTKSAFNVQTEDYKIEIPALVRDKIAKDVAVTVIATCEPMK
ncbi:MAG: YceI family protein [Verrucomicrobia bacterium]|nr:YceI family protein [Cytophagales bacterium]